MSIIYKNNQETELSKEPQIIDLKRLQIDGLENDLLKLKKEINQINRSKNQDSCNEIKFLLKILATYIADTEQHLNYYKALDSVKSNKGRPPYSEEIKTLAFEIIKKFRKSHDDKYPSAKYLHDTLKIEIKKINTDNKARIPCARTCNTWLSNLKI
jgi:molecular chaperone GrpE (heat shock protein)